MGSLGSCFLNLLEELPKATLPASLGPSWEATALDQGAVPLQATRGCQSQAGAASRLHTRFLRPLPAEPKSNQP